MPPSTSPAPASPTSPQPDTTVLKPTNSGVKKPASKKKAKNDGGRHTQKAKLALRKMHVFFKAHRDDDECKGLSYVEQQKVLGKLWKVSPENPKNGGL
ncbi:hypothetical protein C7974DRAFT_416631 [Boeremia exigua]|uniref:uncharacterized protein n=1 Tax=Boeremia exigua TaxID=749465 RepID=UPI001E8CAF01|nr:uncharacterized protein C7974DRAFT_416631 [Boeremia exigua]KAH6616502.1 hypothetical protein C7974DRAFT_416631 [Boeremia exigua]